MEQVKSAPPITVWIHGTHPQALLSWKFSKFLVKQAHTFFECEPGLHLAKGLPKKYRMRSIAETLTTIAPERFDLATFYLFGWSGDLDPRAREKAAQELYQSLAHITTEYQKLYGFKPLIRIITHSHGGNVALNLATVHKEEQQDLVIDELILLACPVQKATEHYVQDPLFKQIYSLHSHVDMMQVLDPQGMPLIKKALKNIIDIRSPEAIKTALQQFKKQKLFSARHFAPQDNLLQVYCKISIHSLLHIEFILPPFVKRLPKLLNALTAWQEGKKDPSIRENKIDLIATL